MRQHKPDPNPQTQRFGNASVRTGSTSPPIVAWTGLLLLALPTACGDASSRGEGTTEQAESGTTDDGTTSGSDPGSEASGGGASEGSGSDDTGDGGSSGEPELDPWSEATAGPLNFRLGPLHTVYEPDTGFDLGSFPVALGVPRLDGEDGTRVLVSFSENPDTSDAILARRVMTTTDLGASYETVEDGAGLTNAAMLEDLSMLSVGFVPVWGSGDSSASLTISRSTDGGLSWSQEVGTFHGGDTEGQIRGLRFHRGLIEIPSGPDAGVLLVPLYGHIGPGPIGDIGSVELAASEDNGVTWTRRGTIIDKRHESDPDETTVEYASDGTMVAVTRAVTPGEPGQRPLMVCSSQDDGRTWSEPEPIQISFDGEPAAPKAAVDPHLHRLPNGVLLLAGGRPDNWVAISEDNGQTWEDGTTTYVNYPENGSRFHGSSGYQAIVSVSSHRAMLFGDNCANSWGCPASDSGWIVDGEYRIWGRAMDVVPADPGRVDLLAAVASGEVTVSTDLIAEQEMLGSLALFDGGVAPGARLRGTGETLIEFAEPRSVTRLAMATAPGSAVAQVLLFDGESWIDPQIASAEAGDRDLRAFEPSAPRQVQAILISFDEAAGPGVLSELELYTTTNSFENETLQLPPRAAEESAMAVVERLDPNEPAQAVRLHDTADDAMARMSVAVPADASSLSLRLRATDLPGGFLFGLTSAGTPMLHLTIDAQGAIRRYDLGAQKWTPVAAEGTVDPFAWMTIDVDLDGGLRIDGVSIDLGDPVVGTPETFYVTSTGTVPVGVDLWIDDLTFAP